MRELENAILRTVLYGDVFSFPMTAREIHHFLITDTPCALTDVEAALRDSATLRTLLEQQGEWIALAGRSALFALRAEREAASLSLLTQARRYGLWLARLPFVRMVAITGALSMRNAADARDDLDFLLVTATGRVWLARAFAIAIVRLARLRGVTVCPNYVLAESALAQDRRDLYVAHELAQMNPLYGFALYAEMRHLNGWSAGVLPNALGPFHAEGECAPGRPFGALKRALEWALSGRLGDALEEWESRRKMRRFQAQMAQATHGARLDGERVQGHFNDHGQRVLHEYALRLREAGIATEPVAGD